MKLFTILGTEVGVEKGEVAAASKDTIPYANTAWNEDTRSIEVYVKWWHFKAWLYVRKTI